MNLCIGKQTNYKERDLYERTCRFGKKYEKVYSRILKKLRTGFCVVLVSACIGCAPAVKAAASPVNPEIDNANEQALELKKMVGQTLIVAVRWDKNGNPIHSLGKNEIAFLKDLQPGGVALFAANLDTVEQTRNLIAQIQGACGILPFIAVDEEGGRVSRLATGRAIGATRIPPAARLARSGREAVSVAYGIIGEELSALGINMDFAPVADLGLNADSEVVGDRAFGSDPLQVAQMIDSAVRALQKQKILAVLKHFPGHGRTSGDSHLGVQTVLADWRTLLRTDLIPFMAAINAGVGAMMTAHIEFPRIEPLKIPVSMSELFLKGKLRTTLGYTGLLVTDALDMGGILSISGPQEAAIRSLNAGIDMLLCPENALEIRDAIVSAIQSGGIKRERLQEAYNLIQKYKRDFGVLDRKIADTDLAKSKATIGSAAHKELLRAALK